MKRIHYDAVVEHMSHVQPKPVTNVVDMAFLPARTLVYGTHLDGEGRKNTFHVYQAGDLIHRLVYSLYPPEVIEYDARVEWITEDLIPSKRSFPERCDFAFIRRVVSQGINPNFTRFDGNVESDGGFAGLVREQLP